MHPLSPQRSIAGLILVALAVLPAILPSPSARRVAPWARQSGAVHSPANTTAQRGSRVVAPARQPARATAAPKTSVPVNRNAHKAPPVASKTPAPAPQPAAHSHPFILGYYVGWAGSGSAADLAAHGGQMTAIAPLWFSLHADASLHLRSFANVAAVTAKAHSVGDKVLAMVTNNGQAAILTNDWLRARAVRSVVDAVLADHLDGVNIDCEMIDGTDAAGLDAFVADVARSLRPHGLLTTVAVGPRAASNLPAGDASDAYDYASLGRSADYVVLMTYDQHGPGTSAGPVAGIGFVRSVVAYALAQMPARKILLGIAGYGYDFAQARTPTVDAAAVALNPPGTIHWSALSQESYIVSPGHDIWVEDARSEAVRMRLARQDGLGGIALWNLGAEQRGFWTNLSSVYGSP